MKNPMTPAGIEPATLTTVPPRSPNWYKSTEKNILSRQRRHYMWWIGTLQLCSSLGTLFFRRKVKEP